MNRRRQPQRTPPPVTSGSEVLEGDAVLQELEGDLSLCLWKSVRTVRLWADLPESEQPRAFTAGSYAERIEQIAALGVEDALRDELESVAEVLKGKGASAAAVSAACSALSQWAVERGATGTALEFAQAAALAQRRDAGLALEVARLAARRGEGPRAESWFRQALFTARQTGDWPAFAHAFLGQGGLQLGRGDVSAARISFLRALRISRRHSLGQIAAAACHRIVEVAILSRRTAEIDRYARAALHGYRGDREGLFALARTLATYLVDRGFFAEGRRLFELVPEDAGAPADHLARTAALAQVGAALGDTGLYRASLAAVGARVAKGGVEGSPAAWIGLLKAAAWAADAEATAMLEPHARHAAESSYDDAAQQEIVWLADPGAEPPDLTIRRAAPALRALVADIEAAIQRSMRRS